MTDSEKLDLLLVKAGKLDSVLVKAENRCAHHQGTF